ncbi:EAL domain-containing protein [Acuticoccus sp. M5D2P5]|uniref:putative bifunctional diguanylate cyclase/phosphodiesterase n=1 Tax=Acuticoccus kalidii TaxID=2910977 RepID=UPI001F41D8A8|nr:EAL domain-containing protein [Acuticoccus kalidii]MCF3932847.1 EAL domain-containing protein [Acuticoccus kalidii]
MLKSFNAALSSLARDQPFDRFADMAELMLDAAVAIVDLNPEPVLVGRGRAASAITPWVVELALNAETVDLAALRDGEAALAGAPLPFAPPFARVVKIELTSGARRNLCLVFPLAPGLLVRRAKRFGAEGNRFLGEFALIQRYRAELRRHVKMFGHVERTAKIGVWEADPHSREQDWSDEVFRIHGLPTGLAPLIDETIASYPEPGRQRLAQAFRDLEHSGTVCDLTLPYVTPDGIERTVHIIGEMQRGGEQGDRLVGIFQDRTTQHKANERLWWMANHDSLTGLPNRALFADRFRLALQRRRRTNALVCLVLVDVDDFKRVNDTLGHAAGDELLKLVAKHLNEGTRANDTVARTGGDEFSIVLEDLRSHEDVEMVLERLRSALRVGLVWGERSMHVTLSAGVAIAPDHGLTEHDLTTAADLALYRMKATPEPALEIYRPVLGQIADERNRALARARDALLEGRIVPAYRPKVEVATGRVVGLAAGASWADGGVSPGADWAVIVEDADLAVKIGHHVTKRAVQEIGALSRALGEPFALSVNASVAELMRSDFLERVASLSYERLPGDPAITVEIAESILLDDGLGRLAARLRQAADAGVRFALGDFGQGYGSLVHASTLPLSEVRLAKRLLADIDADPANMTVVRAIIAFARALDLDLVFDGIATEADARALAELGVSFAHGPYFAPALPIDALRAYLSGENGIVDRRHPGPIEPPPGGLVCDATLS